MKRIYISGPMTGMPGHNFDTFNAEAERLRGLGYEVVNPVDINPNPGTPWADCLRKDLEALLVCDSIALLPGFERSRGATLELYVARALGFHESRAEFITERYAAGHEPGSLGGDRHGGGRGVPVPLEVEPA